MNPWTRDTLRELRAATRTGQSSQALELLRTHPAADTAHTIAPWLIGAITSDVPGARWLGMAIVDTLRTSTQPGDVALVTRLRHALDGQEPPDLALVAVEIFVLSDVLEGGLNQSTSYRLNVQTGAILPEDPEGFAGIPEPPDWEDETVWLYVDAISPRPGWQDMADFVDTIEDPILAEQLSDAIRGRGAFRMFKAIVYETEHEGTRWSLFSDEREAGRARHWLADRGLRPD